MKLRPASPAARIPSLRAKRDFAAEDCPHWDHEGGPYNGMPCCSALEDAEERLRAARRAARGEP